MVQQIVIETTPFMQYSIHGYFQSFQHYFIFNPPLYSSHIFEHLQAIIF